MTSIVPIFPKLFIINNNNKVYEWSIEIKLSDSNSYNIITMHGVKDGKKVTHVKEIKEGKANRSILQQSILDATRKWENKKEKELYVENLGNTISKSEIVRPMLANTFSFDIYTGKSRAFKISFPAYGQRKYDGIRCISYMKNNEIILESRKGIPFQNFTLLKNKLSELFKKLPPNFYFDGELYTDKLDFEVISGLIRLSEKKCTEKDILEINKIEYHIYDFINLDHKELTYKDRYIFLKDFLTQNSSSLCKQVETILINNLDEIKIYHDKFVQEGYEGIMIRDILGVYETNKRSKYLQKFKEFMDEEFKIVGFHEGTGDEKGSIVWDCITKEGKPFAVRPKGTFESRKELFNDGDKYIGKLLTVIFQEYSSDNIPRFPVGKGIREQGT